ncbi:MAG TPA: M48 family metalloprotease [Fimbriimonadaceae bacterium]|nr:M48 family metalloprotease [Fimbriimonadaceae bacterium]
MIGLLSATILAANLAHGGCATCAHGDDWRAELPIEVRLIVARVDQQVAVDAQSKASLDEKTAAEKAKHDKDIQSDIEMGKKYAAQVVKEMKVSENAEMIARVQRIGSDLSIIANQKPVQVSWGDPRLNVFPYQFQVLQGEDVNAFSIPGGFIFIYEGLVKYAESDDELAGVIAHEISHAAFRHIATLRREQSKFDIVQIPLILAAIFTGGATAQGLLVGGSLFSQAMTSGWSVKAEESADWGGFQYMQSSKYNPVGMLTFMERLAYDERNKPQFDWGIYRTHPPGRQRAQSLVRRLGDAGILIRRSQVTTSLKTQVKPGEQDSVDLLFNGVKLYSFRGADALTRADKAAVAFDAFMDTVPKIFEIQADGAVVEGRGRPLVEVLPEDLQEGQRAEDVAADAVRALKRAAYDLSYRVWDAF